MRNAAADTLVSSVHAPGPSKGTSTREPDSSTPASAPLIAGALGAGAADLTVELVTLSKLVSVGCARAIVVVVDVVGGVEEFLASATVVVVRGAEVIVVDVGAAGIRALEVRVNTSTSSSTGLDHISKCVLFSECIRVIDCEG